MSPLPGISTTVPGGYVDPSGLFGVTVTSPVLGSCSKSTVGVTLAGVVTSGTSTDGLPGSVILPGFVTLPSGNSLFGTLPLPSSPIVTVIGLSPLPGISTTVPGGYVEPSGFLGVTVTSPVLGSCSKSTVGVLRAGVVAGTGCDGLLFGSVTVPSPSIFPFGRLSFGTIPEPSSPMITSIGVSLSPGITTFVPSGYVPPTPGFFGVTIASPFGFLVISIETGCSVCGSFGSNFLGVFT